MKIYLLFALFAILLVAGCNGLSKEKPVENVSNNSIAAYPECYDSDFGKDVYTKGTIAQSDLYTELPIVDKCSENGNLVEYYCDNGYMKSIEMQCPEGSTCNDGACIEKAEPPETDNATKTEDKEKEPSVCLEVYSPVCGKDGKTYSNSCFAALAKAEISHPGECSGADYTRCIKSDNSSIYSKGTARLDGKELFDICTSSSTLKEYTCSENQISSNIVQCPSEYSCKDGACIKNEQKCEGNTDIDLFTAGLVNVTKTTGFVLQYNDVCDVGKVRDYYCDGSDAKFRTVECPNGYLCDLGKCVHFSYCYDFDGGIYPDIASNTSVGDNVYSDRCKDNSIVSEYYCDGGNLRSVDKDCTITGKTCVNGGCQ